MKQIIFFFILLSLITYNKSVKGEQPINSQILNEQSSSELKEIDGVFYFSVTSDGTTGKQWLSRLKALGTYVSREAEEILCSKNFKPTNGVTYKIAILPYGFSDGSITTSRIKNDAQNRGLSCPNTEVACLMRVKLSNRDLVAMNLVGISVMHYPIQDLVLSIHRYRAISWLSTECSDPGIGWDYDTGFAFVASKTK